MNAIAMLERCAIHQGGEDGYGTGYGNDGSYISHNAVALAPSDRWVEGWRPLAIEEGPAWV